MANYFGCNSWAVAKVKDDGTALGQTGFQSVSRYGTGEYTLTLMSTMGIDECLVMVTPWYPSGGSPVAVVPSATLDPDGATVRVALRNLAGNPVDNDFCVRVDRLTPA